jgi:hypothetical protein
MANGVSAASVAWTVAGIVGILAVIAGIVLIPVTIGDNLIGPCNDTEVPLDITGVYNGTFSCEGVGDSGTFTESDADNVWTIYHNTGTGLVEMTDTSTGHAYKGAVPNEANLRGNRELAFYTGHVPYFEVGRWEILRTCTANRTTLVTIRLMGQSIVAGDDPTKVTKTCTERLTLTTTDVPPTPAPTAAPTPAP